MSVIISGVSKNSIASKLKIKNNQILYSINGYEINDILDFEFYEKDENITLCIDGADYNISKDTYEPIGLIFDTYLMDKQKGCRNKCIFCFIDQLPKGLRETLYFKDDDDRLSFLFGNYITLTNLEQKDIDRIIKMKISPINISVHTTNKQLRCEMTNNRFAGDSLDFMYQLAQAGIKINCQLVLCPGINDGIELENSLSDLEKLYPSVSSVACVPVGLTKFRKDLFKLSEYTKETAINVVRIIEKFGDEMKNNRGTRLFYPADEFFLKAEIPIPDYDYYEEFSQIENGVGMLSMFKDEFEYALETTNKKINKRNISIATGMAAYPFIKNFAEKATEKWNNISCNVYPIENEFFGSSITVSGLITGTDIYNQLKEKSIGEQLLIPQNMLRKEMDMFLDNMTVNELEQKLNTKICIVPIDGGAFLDCLLG